MSTATAETDSVIKPDFDSRRKHLIFTTEHEDLRESMEAWVKKEVTPRAQEFEENLWDSAILMVSCRLHTYIAQGRTVGVSERAGKQEGLA